MRVMGVAAVIVGLIVPAVGAALYWFEDTGDAAVIVGLIVLVFLFGISAGWLSGERRTRVMGVAVVVFAFIVLAVGATMYWFEQMSFAPVIIVTIVLVFLLGMSAGWLSRGHRMRVIGIATLIVGLIVLAFVVLTGLLDLTGFAIAMVGLIVLVFLLGISAGRLSSDRRMRVTGVVIVMVGLIVLAFASTMYWFDEIEPRLCAESDRIVTTEQVKAFGKRHLLDNDGFWLGLKASREEIEEILRGNCCDAGKGDFLRNDPSRWHVHMGGWKAGKYEFTYSVFFSECGKAVEILKGASFLK